MKKALIYIFVALAGFFAGQAISFAADEGDYETVKLYKKIIPGSAEGEYTIKLEAFVTGSSTYSSSVKAADIVLVLDMSQSMQDPATYVAQQSTAYSYEGFANQTLYYKHTDGKYYKVSRGRDRQNRYSDYYHYLYYTVSGTTYYLSGTGTTTTRPTNITGTGTTIWTGVLYKAGTSKINLLKPAVQNFISVVAENAKAANVDHRIGIVRFAANSTNTNGSRIVQSLTSAKNNESTLKTTVGNMNLGTYTRSDKGMEYANSMIDGNDTTHTKIVVMFTDGLPNETSSRTYFDYNVANPAIANSKLIKDKGAKVYTIGIFDDETAEVKKYMNYVSSNYPAAESMTVGGTGKDDGYYQLSDGSDLSDIFEKIAKETTSDVVDLHESSTSMIDIVSNNFKIPDDVVSAGKVSVEVWKANGYDETKKDVDYFYNKSNNAEYYYGFTFEKDDDYTAAHTPTVVKDQDKPNSISISNFDYALDDVETGDCTGNWVGLRDVNGVKWPAGRKIVITFPITLNPDYQGGYFMPSNDFHSGIYADGNLVKTFPVPSVDFPSICIVKHGMLVGESAIFHVDGTYKDVKNNTKTVHYDVVLTQKANASGTKLPCYAILKRLNSGSYTVTETNWSWMYEADEAVRNGARSLTYSILPADQVGVTTELLSEGQDLEQNGGVIGKTATKSVSIDDVSVLMPFVMLKDSQGEYVDSAISILYEFGNVRKTSGKPARGESWKNNKFKGGTNNTGTTEGGVSEEEDI